MLTPVTRCLIYVDSCKGNYIPKCANESDHDPITLKEFEEVLKQIFQAKPKLKDENKIPTKAELEQRWKLVRARD